MTKTVTSLFHHEPYATAAAKRLEQAGIPSDHIDIWSNPHNLASFLEDAGVSRSDANAYVEGVIRGGSVVIVNCSDDKVGQVVGILDHEGVLDLDEQQASWRSEGWPEPTAEETPGSLPNSIAPAQVGTGATEELTGGSTRSPASTNMTTGRTDEIGHGRVRIQAGKVGRPAQK